MHTTDLPAEASAMVEAYLAPAERLGRPVVILAAGQPIEAIEHNRRTLTVNRELLASRGRLPMYCTQKGLC